MKKFVYPFLFSIIFISCASNSISYDYVDLELPETPSTIFETFEDGTSFYAITESWELWEENTIPTSCEISKNWSSEGANSLICKTMSSNDSEDLCRSLWAIDVEVNADWSNYTNIAFDINNTSSSLLEFSIAIQGTKLWKWEETSSMIIPSGVHKILLPLTDFNDDIKSDIRRVFFQITGIHDEITFYMDNLRLYQ